MVARDPPPLYTRIPFFFPVSLEFRQLISRVNLYGKVSLLGGMFLTLYSLIASSPLALDLVSSARCLSMN